MQACSSSCMLVSQPNFTSKILFALGPAYTNLFLGSSLCYLTQKASSQEVPTHIKHFTFPSPSNVGLLTDLTHFCLASFMAHRSYNPPPWGPCAHSISISQLHKTFPFFLLLLEQEFLLRLFYSSLRQEVWQEHESPILGEADLVKHG